MWRVDFARVDVAKVYNSLNRNFFVNVYEMERLSGKTGVVNQKMCHISFLLGAGEWAL